MKRTIPKIFLASVLACLLVAQPALAATDISTDSTLSTGLVSCWLTDAANLTTPLLGTNYLTNNNSVTLTTGKSGNAGLFDSALSQYLSITDASQTGLDFTSDLSASAWVKYDTDPDTALATVLSKYTGATNRSYLWDVGDGTTMRLVLFNAAGSASVPSAAWNPTTGVWYHIGFAYDASAGQVVFFLDGAQLGATSTGVVTNIRNGAAPFTIGERDGGSFMDGTIHQVCVSSAEWSLQQFKDLYNSGSGIYYKAPTSTPATGLTPGANDIIYY